MLEGQTTRAADVTEERRGETLSAIVLRDLAEARPYEPAWRALAGATDQPFGTPAWMWAWWKNAAPVEARLRTVVVSSGDEVVGIAPLFAERRWGVWRYRILGAGVSSRVDFLARPGREREVASAVAGCLREESPRPDVIVFDGIRSDSPWPELLAQVWPSKRKPRLYREYSMPSPFLGLSPPDFAAWFGGKSSHFRARMRRGVRKLEAMGGAVRLVSEPHDVEQYVSEFARLHRSRWVARGGSGVLTDRVERALREAALRPEGESPVDLWVVDLPGGTLSVQVFVRAGREVCYWLGGFDEELPGTRPGPAILTLFRVVERACSSGATGLDLGPGDQPYKGEFAEAAETLEWLTVCLSRPRCLMARTAFTRARVRNGVTRRLSPGVKRYLRRLRRGLTGSRADRRRLR
jgi:CelD/BcsL family acetyltransferase involved in cellulose biosynthesis